MEKKKVLVIEDEYSINDVLTIALRKEGYDGRSALNGKDGLELVKSFKPDLVLLDLMLPDMNGFDICKKISNEVYVIMVTARGEMYDKIIGLELGADDYIVKPFEIKEVLVRIKVIFRRYEKYGNNLEEKQCIDNNGLKLLRKERRVFKDEEEIHLRRKEFDLLKLFYDNRGVVFSRDDLLEKVWGYEYQGDTRTVDVHIRRLRDKIKEDKNSTVIETVFGVGYVMR